MSVTPLHHIAVLRFSSAGDVLLTAPALRALRVAWPQTRITFVTHAAFAPLVSGNPDIDTVITLPAKAGLRVVRQALSAAQPDGVLDLHGKWRGVFLRYSLPLERRVVWHKRPLSQTLALRLGGGRYRARCHIAARYHAAVEKLVGQALPRQPLNYAVLAADQTHADTALHAHKITLDKPLVGMSPGALWHTKRWPAQRFGALAAWALGQGYQVVLTGSPAEAAITQEVQALAPGCVDLAGALDLGSLGGVINRCQVFVANDSGPMHMARALGVPTVAFFGSTDPHQFDFTGHALLFADAPCSPCSFHGLAACPRGHMRCLMDLNVERAAMALQALLSVGRVARVMG